MSQDPPRTQTIGRVFWTVILVSGGALRGFEVLPQVAATLIVGGLIGFTLFELRAERQKRIRQQGDRAD